MAPLCAEPINYVLVEQVELKEPGQDNWTPNPSTTKQN